MLTLTHTSRTDLAQLATRNSLPVGAVIAVRAAYLITLWSFRHRSRNTLKRLSAQQLEDIGMTKVMAHAEFRKRFWRP